MARKDPKQYQHERWLRVKADPDMLRHDRATKLASYYRRKAAGKIKPKTEEQKARRRILCAGYRAKMDKEIRRARNRADKAARRLRELIKAAQEGQRAKRIAEERAKAVRFGYERKA